MQSEEDKIFGVAAEGSLQQTFYANSLSEVVNTVDEKYHYLQADTHPTVDILSLRTRYRD